MRTRTRTHTHTHTRTRAYTHTHTHMRARTHARTQALTHTRMHARTHAHNQHTRARARASLCTFFASILRHHLVDFLDLPSLSLLIFFLSDIVSSPTSISSSSCQSNMEPSSPPCGTSAYTDCRFCLPPNKVSKMREVFMPTGVSDVCVGYVLSAHDDHDCPAK